MFCQSDNQQIKKLSIRQLAEIDKKGIKDIAISTEPVGRGFWPKILVGERNIEFLSQGGVVKNRITFDNEFYTTFPFNEKFIGINQMMKIPQNKNKEGSGMFQLFTDEGVFLWKESFPIGWDSHAPIYQISSNGNVCKIEMSGGTLSFYDKQGVIIAKHIISSFDLVEAQYGWSQDGHYFAITSPYRRERIENKLRYDDKLTLFDSGGIKRWEQILQDKSVSMIFMSSKWVIVRHENMTSRSIGATLFSTSKGQPGITMDGISIRKAVFIPNGDLFILEACASQTPCLALYESVSGKKAFEVNMHQRILDVKLSTEDNRIYVLLGERIAPTGRRVEQRTTPEKLRFTNIKLMALNMSGNILGSTELPSIESVSEKLLIHSVSASKGLVIKAGRKVIQYGIE